MKDLRIAWIYPSLIFGAYWQPVINEFIKQFKNTRFYTGCLWPGFNPEAPGSSVFQTVGKTQFIQTVQVNNGYDRGFIIASPTIILHLFKFRPQIIFASAFSIWTILALFLKPICQWKLIIIYDGSSPNTEFRDSRFRVLIRKLISKFTDTFIANSCAAMDYLIQVLKVPQSKIHKISYLVPDDKALLQNIENAVTLSSEAKHPVFLYVGQLIPRKGIKYLLQACCLLRNQGYSEFTLLIVGDGPQRKELQDFVDANKLANQILWAGWVDYSQLGHYFNSSDVFVFPTLEDVWGMVVLEAMVFGKPILCSKGANASELIVEGKNGYLFDPLSPEELAAQMCKLIRQQDIISSMGLQSKQIISEYNPRDTAQSFGKIIASLTKNYYPLF
jgi:glycosyltransferase involved in cell wall biosynthesis